MSILVRSSKRVIYPKQGNALTHYVGDYSTPNVRAVILLVSPGGPSLIIVGPSQRQHAGGLGCRESLPK